MQKISLFVAGSLIAAGAMPVTAQTARNSPDQIVCQLSGVCEKTQADASRQIAVGDEKAFSLAKPNAAKPAATNSTLRVPAATPRRAAVATRASRPAPGAAFATTSGGLDMLVTFATGSASLTNQAKAEVRAFAKALESPALSGMRFRIEGHTDAVGNRDYNLDLSRRRADAVAEYLGSLGVDRSRLETRGYGFDKPRPGTTPRAAVNRRVEFAKAI